LVPRTCLPAGRRTKVATRFVKLLKDKISDFDRTGLLGSLQHDFSNKNYEGHIFLKKWNKILVIFQLIVHGYLQ
jgi:hypothetical protein